MLRRRSKRAILGFLFLSSIAALLLFSISRYFAGKEVKRLYLEEKAAIQQPSPNLHKILIESREQRRRYPAEVLPWMDAKVAAEVSGEVLSADIEAGMPVEKGFVLVQLDPTLAELEVQAARARHKESERLRAEAETLTNRSVGSRTDFEAAIAREVISRAELEIAEERLQRHSIRAPFTGIINRRLVEVGSSVMQNTQVAELIDLSRQRVIFYVSDLDVASFTPGKKVHLTLLALPGKTFEPLVEFVSRAADAETRLFRVEALLEDSSQIPARSQGIVEAAIEGYKELPFVPASAVAIIGRQSTVSKVTSGEDEKFATEQISIEIGPEINGAYPVLSGLNGGDTILIR